MLAKARDGYRYINDQTLRLANHGFTPVEIAEQVEFPPELADHWAMRPYYGSVSHNVKATYSRYLGWFDGNPANLHVHPPEYAARKYVEMMGGADTVVAQARAAFDDGDYRWVAEVVKHVVFAEPDHAAGKELLADAFEQLGYQAETGPWRNFYLTGAKELRDGVVQLPTPNTASPDSARAITINVSITDTGDRAVMFVANGSLNHSTGHQATDADATLTMTRPALDGIILDTTDLTASIADGAVGVAGDPDTVQHLLALLDTFELWFNIVTP
jgi:alkyl sulfatase BDS1-like metallo-beta-lactamase superfamily hydrolase